MNSNNRETKNQNSDQNDSSQTVIKGSQRSDGTFRKDIKIRDGFINFFDAEKYKIPQRRGDNGKPEEDNKPQRNNQGTYLKNEGGQQNQTWRNQNNNNLNNGNQQSSNNYNKKDVNLGNQISRSNNIKQGQEKQNYNKLNEVDFPDFIGNDNNNTQNINSEANHRQQLKQNDYQNKQDRQIKTNSVNIKSSDSNQGFVKESEEGKNSSTKDSNKQQFNSHISNIVSTNAVNKEKEMKKLSKKLREIEQLEQKQQKGLELQPEAVEKISKKDEIIKLLDNLSLD